MKVAVVGGGGVCGYLYGLLATARADLTRDYRSGKADAIRTGLTIVDRDEEFRVAAPVVVHVMAKPVKDFRTELDIESVRVCVKALTPGREKRRSEFH